MMNDSELDALLRESKPTVPMPHTFQAEVWRRIAVAEEATLWRKASRWLKIPLGMVTRPLGAAALCAVTVGVGLLLGGMKSPTRLDGKVAYLDSVSPFVATHRSAK